MKNFFLSIFILGTSAFASQAQSYFPEAGNWQSKTITGLDLLTSLTSTKVLTVTSCTQTSGTLKLVLVDLVLTATGACGPFQYVYVFDQASTGDKLIGYYNHGSAVTMALNDTFTIDFDAGTGALTIA
jgi:hypothetical protein